MCPLWHHLKAISSSATLSSSVTRRYESRLPGEFQTCPGSRKRQPFWCLPRNGGRLQTISKLRGKPFPNNHLDLLFNATVDAALVGYTFIRAAEAVGLGCCPISAIDFIAKLLAICCSYQSSSFQSLDLCVGWPAQRGEINPRLSLRTTVVENNYLPRDLAGEVEAYDRRHKLRAYNRQRNVDRWGTALVYGCLKIKRANTLSRCAATLAVLCAERGFAWSETLAKTTIIETG